MLASPGIGHNGGPVWEPLEGSQALALDTRCDVTLFTGSRGPGKTDCQIMRFRRRVGQGYGPFWRGIIFDREYKNLDDIVSKVKRWFPLFKDGGRFLESKADYKYVWPTGEELLFRAIKKDSDYNNFHGQEFPFIGWNELTKYPTPKLYDLMFSCNRSSYLPAKDGFIGGKDVSNGPPVNPDTNALPNSIPLETFITTNSYGPGHNWVKSRFITVAPYGKVVRVATNVYNPQTNKDEISYKTQVAIFGSYRENKYLDPKYVAQLVNQSDENIKRSWLKGDWDIVAGGAFDDVFIRNVHVIPRFVVPHNWHIDRAFDWGSTDPFAVGWFAEANGEEVKFLDGITFAPRRGSLIQIAEIYGAVDLNENVGLRISAGDIALKIRAYEQKMLNDGWILRQPWGGPADNQIRDVREKDVDTIESKMKAHGIAWERSDKSPGSRKVGLEIMRERMRASISGEGPGWYCTQNCEATHTILPTLPRDEDDLDDVDQTAPEHVWDMTRYRVLKGANRFARSIHVRMPT